MPTIPNDHGTGRTRAGLRPDAWMAALHAEHADPLFRFLLGLTCGERHLAEDLLQETMLRARRNLHDLPVDREIQRRWLFTVARRLVIGTARDRRASPSEAESPAGRASPGEQ